MSGSFQFPMSSKYFNPQTIEMEMKEETSSKEDDSGEDFIHETEETLTIDEIDIKYEEMDFNLYHTSTADDHSEDHSDLCHETMSNIAHVECESTKSEENDLNDFYLDLLLCDRDCETCVKYMRMLSKHVRATHAPPQPIQDPLLIDPVPLTDQSSSSIQTKGEVDEIILKKHFSDSEEVTAPNSDPEPDYNMESDSESEHSDPDYAPPPTLTQNLRHQRLGLARKPVGSQPSSSKSKKENLPSREHFKCGQCGKSFNRKIRLKEHMAVHTSEKPFQCDVCDRSFARSYHLTEHKRIHTGERPFKCDLCEKSFAKKNHLTVHNRVHTGEKPFKCDVCEKGFALSHHLTEHMRTHTGEKPFKCEVCDKSFSQRNALSKHKRIHSQERPYKCDVCDMSFKRSTHLKEHTRVHTGDKPFKCDLCEKSFPWPYRLNEHKRSHTGEKTVQM